MDSPFAAATALSAARTLLLLPAHLSSLYLFLLLQLGRRQPGSSAVGTMNWNAKDYNEISLNCIWSEHVRAAPFVALQCTPSRRLLFAATVRPFGTPGLSSRVRVLRPASGGEGGEADSKGYQDDVHVQSVLVARAEQRPRQPPYAAQRPNAVQGAAIPGARRQRRPGWRARRARAAPGARGARAMGPQGAAGPALSCRPTIAARRRDLAGERRGGAGRQ